jgi:predicted butyrate kinase (DUF1464 family)
VVRAVGTDSGTKSYDILGFDDETGEVFVDESIPREEMVANPYIVVKRLREIDKVHHVDAIVASSGYGIPLKLARDATDEEIALATFVTESDVRRRLRIIGLRKLLKLLKDDPELSHKTYFTPGVIHLPTVPLHRKVNRIDMGTSDKVYTAALAIARHAELHSIDYSKVDLVAVEIGFAYTSALAVKSGEIVDAVAGTAGFPGYLGLGFIDGELAYALANTIEFSKELLFRGGAAYLSNTDPFKTPVEEFVKLKPPGYELLLESVVKDVLALLSSTKPSAIYLSGRFSRIPQVVEDLHKKLEEVLNALSSSYRPQLAVLESRGKVAKQAAEGAAIIANGLAGGKYKKLVETLRLRESRGTIFDYVTVIDRDQLIKRFSKYMD